MGDGSNSERTDGGVFEHQYAGPGKYEIRLIVQTEFGCTDTVNRELEINTPSLEAGNDLYVIRGGRVQFNIQATGTGLIYKWTPSLYLDQDDIKNPTVSPVSDTRYSITITSEEGCELTDDIMVRVVESPVIPNTFTPNGDGINDEWNILYLDTYPGVKVSIFNRFGVKLFSSEGYSQPWNGFFNGQELPAGTYYYVIETDEGLPDYSGWVALLK